jgi:hypothetical protein
MMLGPSKLLHAIGECLKHDMADMPAVHTAARTAPPHDNHPFWRF